MNILVVSPGNINRPRGGAGNRAHYLAHYLQRFGNRITVLEPADKNNCQSADGFSMHYYFGKIGRRSLSAFCDINPFFIVKLLTILANYEIDLIHVELPWGVCIAKISTLLLRKDISVVYNSQNLQKKVQKDVKEHYRKSPRSSIEDRFISTALSQYTAIIEKLATRLSDQILCVSKKDARLFVDEYGVSYQKLKLVPNGTDYQKITTAVRDKKRYRLDNAKIAVVFHGPQDYPPNAEAIAATRNLISPAVMKDHAEVEFVIAGAGTEEACEHSLMICLGYVEDIYSLLKSCDIAIVPITSGGGTRLKILDYLGTGLPVVTTRKGIEGVDAIDGEDALIVDEINREFIDALLYLIRNAEERKRIGKNAAILAKEYDWERIAHGLNASYIESFEKAGSTEIRTSNLS
jgi:glycosyltransferase involved in cell wall biosynthesis